MMERQSYECTAVYDYRTSNVPQQQHAQQREVVTYKILCMKRKNIHAHMSSSHLENWGFLFSKFDASILEIIVEYIVHGYN